jgi:hypothetical protein
MKPRLLGAACLLLLALVLVLMRGGQRSDPAAAASGSPASPLAEVPDTPIQAGAPRPAVQETGSVPTPAEAKPDVAPSSSSRAPEAPGGDSVGCVLYGRVSDASGGSLAGKEIVVWLEDESGVRVVAGMTAPAAYSATGLAPGRWLVNSYVAGYHATRVPIELVPEGAIRHDIEVEPAIRLRVKLTAPDGSPFREALARSGWTTGHLIPVATVDPPGALIEGVSGNEHVGAGQFWDNGYVFEQLPPEYYGVLVLDGEPPIHVSLVLQSAVLATQRVEPGAEEVAFVLAPDALLAARSTLLCRVVEAGTGAPFEGAEVRLADMSGSARYPRLLTDAQGEAVLADNEPGRYELSVSAEGRAAVVREVALLPGQTLELDPLELVPETWITGRLVDAAGAPVEGIIEVARLEADGRPSMVREFAKTEQGAFRIGNLLPGRYVVRSAAREGRPHYPQPTHATANREVSTLNGPVEELELALLPLGRLVLLYERADWEALRYSVLDAQGLERAGGRLWQTSQESAALPHGDYRLIVTGAGGQTLLERAITVGEEPVAIELPRE